MLPCDQLVTVRSPASAVSDQRRTVRPNGSAPVILHTVARRVGQRHPADVRAPAVLLRPDVGRLQLVDRRVEAADPRRDPVSG